MDHRIGKAIIALAGAWTWGALAQASTPAAPGTALPPQNYGVQPGFFRSAAEMNVFANPAASVPQPVAQPIAAPATPAAAPAPVAAAAPQAVSAPADTRIPDPTQNLQWAERQMDRSENAAAAQAKALNAAPQPIAPGAYNGETDPATR
jgi:hypothetical protein